MNMGVREKRESPINPALLKFGLALAISIGGIVYTFFKSKRFKPSKPKPSPGGQLRDQDCASQDISPLRVSSQDPITDLASSSRQTEDRSVLLLQEFDQFVREHNMANAIDDVSPRKIGQLPEESKCVDHEIEIRGLQDKVKVLEERERTLETQLLEYYGLKEQETAIVELQNRLRLHNMEAKLYNLKIESLQADKKKLEAQVAGYADVVAELEAANAKIRLLRKKLTTEAEQNREQILNLQKRVMKLHDQENKGVEIDHDVELKLQKEKELEELEEMKKYNYSLKLENSELAQKLERAQMLATSSLDDKEVQAFKEETELLRQQNEDLRKEIEQLHSDRCTDIEELVYMRWINACLRYEMRNYQPGPGKTIARDLSITLSPESEKKAKQLILEYANKEGASGQKGIDIRDFDSDRWSIPQDSYFTYFGEHDDSSTDNFSENRASHASKTKVFAKLMKLLRGKDSHHHNHQIQTPSSPLELDVSENDTVSRYSSTNGVDGLVKTSRASSGGSSEQSVDLQRSRSQDHKKSTSYGESSNSSRRMSDDGSVSIFRRIDSITGHADNSSPGIQPHQDAHGAAKIELVKYAEALKNTGVKPSFRRRSASFGSL